MALTQISKFDNQICEGRNRRMGIFTNITIFARAEASEYVKFVKHRYRMVGVLGVVETVKLGYIVKLAYRHNVIHNVSCSKL